MAVNEAGYSDYSNTITVQTNATSIASIQEQTIHIYPNPAKNHFFVDTELTNDNYCQIEIVNMAGQVIYKTITESALTLIETGTWQNGVCIIRIQSPNGTIVRKIVISR